MLYPSVDKLVKKVDSRYTLVTIISKRARQLITGEEPLVYAKSHKPVSIAIEEFYEGKINVKYEEEEKEDLEAWFNYQAFIN